MTRIRATVIGDVVSIVGGGTPTRNNREYYGGDIPWVTPKDMKSREIYRSQISLTSTGLKSSAAQLIPANSVLIVVRSGVLKHTLPVALNRREVAINQDMKALICSDRVDPGYLAYFIEFRAPQILKWVRATTADNFSIENLRNLEISLPGIDEQREIVAALDGVNDLRVLRKSTIALVDELSQALFVKMFGDPVDGTMEWPIKKIGSMLSSATYGTSEKAALEGELPVLRMGNITTSGEIDLRSLKYMPLATPERYIAREGDVLFNRTNSADLVGKTAIYRGTIPLAYAGYLVRLRVNEDNHPEYLAAFMNTRYAKRILRDMCKSIVGMANINAKEVQGIDIAVPPLALQREFADQIAALNSLKNHYRTHLMELDGLFTAMRDRSFRESKIPEPQSIA